jgi:hypothetical protein
MADDVHRWELTVHGRHHRVEVEGSFSRTVRWYVDDVLVATKKSTEDKVTVEPEPQSENEPDGAGEVGALGLRFSALGRAKRVTLHEPGGDVPAMTRAAIGTGGIDLDPEPGSPAALREQRIREHPVRHAAVATAGGVAKVVVPLLLGLLAVRVAVDLPWPDWNIPWPDLDLPDIPWPDIPWPDIPWPDIPWPDVNLPDWQLPAWVGWILDKLKYVWPVVLAAVLAKGEIDRRRKQDALKSELKAAQEAAAKTVPKPDPRTGQEVGPQADQECEVEEAEHPPER